MDEIFKKIDSISALKNVESINVFGKYLPKVQPRFSILIPTFKRPNTLGDTIDSAINQYDFRDYDIIVVDNNPDRGDKTEEFMQKYQNIENVYYYKNTENVGLAGNWNKCFLLSHSENVILVHDDDVLSPFALKIFSKVLEQLPNGWAVYKPLNKRFTNVSELNFKEYSSTQLLKISTLHFMVGSAIDAPSIILLNKSKMLDIGGVNNQYFPCIDYMMTMLATFYHKSYISSDIILGGYRVAQNESLSTKTMDNFFLKRTEISSLVMKHFKVPSILKEILTTANFAEVLSFVKVFYNMPNYTYELPNRYTCKMTKWQINLANKCYYKLMGALNMFNRKKVDLSKNIN